MGTSQTALFAILATLCLCTQPSVHNNTSITPQANNTKLIYQYFIFQSNCFRDYHESGIAALRMDCFIYTIAQIFNIILLALCLVLRVPQIMVIARNQSVYGLSYFGNNLELLMTSMTLAYGLYANFSFWIYGQNILLSIQNLIIISLFFQYPLGNSKDQRLSYIKSLILPIIATLFVSSLFILQLVPDFWQQASIWLQLIVFLGARGSQIINNYKYKTTQNLSSKTMMITLFANLARTITILVESPSSIGYLLNYLIPIFVNGIIVAQILWYSQPKHKKTQ